MVWTTLNGEHYSTKSVGVLDNEQDAVRAAEWLKRKAGLRDRQITMVHPYERQYGNKIEPETRGIAKTAIRSHTILGVAGLLVGLLIWALLYATGWQALRTSPLMAAIAILFFSTAAGMMLGGLMTARPDHDNVIFHVRDAARQGKWSVIAHTRGTSQLAQAKEVLGTTTDRVWSSL